MLNLSENGNYNPALAWINKCQKIFLCVQVRSSNWRSKALALDTEKSFSNQIKSNRNQIIFTIFRFISGWFSKIPKRFLCVHVGSNVLSHPLAMQIQRLNSLQIRCKFIALEVLVVSQLRICRSPLHNVLKNDGRKISYQIMSRLGIAGVQKGPKNSTFFVSGQIRRVDWNWSCVRFLHEWLFLCNS